MNIKEQKAETIYNIAGNMHVHTSEEVINLLNHTNQEKLKELHSISFFDILSKEYSQKSIIDRIDECKNIKEILESTRQLILYGEPGIGKTTTIFQLTQKLENVIYISLKNKSPISIYSYLINKIRIASNKPLIEVTEINEAQEWLQSCLQWSKQYFIIDDCEAHKETADKIISLEKFDTHFLLATRNKALFEASGEKFYKCNAFNEEEIRLFLKSNKINLTTLEFNDILKASNGNPLYLYYFTHFQISPLPENLIEFQNSIWANLLPTEQEIIATISIAHFDIKIDEVSEILKYNSLLEFSKQLDRLSALTKNFNGILEIFHPSFKEFVISTLHSKGLLKQILLRIGSYYLKKNKIIQATFLLIDIAPQKVRKYSLDVFPRLIMWGELKMAEKVLKSILQTSKTNFQKGYIYYHLCNLYHLLGNKEESTSSIDKSLDHLRRSNRKQFYTAALMFKAMDLVNEGKVEEATEIADNVFSELKNRDKYFKGVLLVNLSKIYVDLSEFEKGARACKEAFEIFEEKGIIEGMKNSLVNLISCLAQIKEHKDDAEKYGLRMLELIDKNQEFTIEAVVLNALSSIYRQKKEYEKARSFSDKAIKLCQRHEMKDKVILNLVNYGNILRDEEKIEEAKKVYEEALVFANEYNLKKDQGRIYWILASMSRKAGDLKLSLEHAEKSAHLCKEINFYYGVAMAFEQKAKTLKLMNETILSAESLISSAEYFSKIDQFTNDYQHNISKAIAIFKSEGNYDRVNQLINQLISSPIRKIDYGDIISLIRENSRIEDLESNFIDLFTKYFTIVNNSLNIFRDFLSFIEFCKVSKQINGIDLYKKVLSIIITNLGIAKFSYSILGIAIEQSGNLLSQYDVDEILELLKNKLPFFICRNINDEKIIITSIENKINLEIHSFDDELVCTKLSIAATLFLHENPKLVIDEEEFKENKCIIWLHTFTDEMKRILAKPEFTEEILFAEDSQTAHMQKANYDLQEMILVSPEYEIKSDLIVYPDNKASLHFFVSIISGIKSHFYHKDIQKEKKARQVLLGSVAFLFDYKNALIGKEQIKSEFEIDLGKITP